MIFRVYVNLPGGTGWWYTYPAEKYESVGGGWNFPTEWKVIKFQGSKPPTRYCIYVYIYIRIYIYIAWDCTKGYDQFWSSPQVGISQNDHNTPRLLVEPRPRRGISNGPVDVRSTSRTFRGHPWNQGRCFTISDGW